jgi:amidase
MFGADEDAPAASGHLSRRTLLRMTALVAVAAPGLAQLAAAPAVHADAVNGPRATEDFQDRDDLVEATIAQLQAAMAAGRLSARELAGAYIQRIEQIDQHGPRLNSILEVNPDALDIAEALDRERRQHGPRGPLHGIPILVKDNIDSADRMQTTAGSLALLNVPVHQDSTTVQRLRQAGAVVLGKTNLSEWANFRSTHSSSGWSGRGGQCNNPYVLDRNPCGSSSGSGAAVSANLSAAAIGTETDGSIVCPATNNGVVGIKPTVGLTSRAGVVPISHTQDTIGPLARTVADAATVLGAMTGVDPRDSATSDSAGKSFTDYRQFLDADRLKGARIGVARDQGFGRSEKTDAIMETAIAALSKAGATIVDNLNITNRENGAAGFETTVLLFDFKHDIATYLSSRPGGPQTLQDLIDFNNAHAAEELKFFGQERFLAAQRTGGFGDPTYQAALARSQGGSRSALRELFTENQLDAIVAPTGSPAWTTDLVDGDHFILASTGPAARAGFPLLSVPAGFSFGLPVNITFMGLAFSEPKLIALGFAFEQATRVRQPPNFLRTLPS